MAEWLKGCEVCNAGLCARFDELIGQGMSQRQAAKELEKDQKKELGAVVYSAQALRRRLQQNRVAQNGPPLSGKVPKPPKPYTNAVYLADIAISQLERITPDDPKREKAFKKVISWINEQIKDGKK